MAYYNNPAEFKPSQETLLQWLKTRKSDNDVKPGFFETIDFTKDQSWTIIAILIELAALFFTLYGGLSKYQINGKISTLITAGVIVVLFIAFDIIGVLLHSNDKKERVINKNRLKLIKNPVVREGLIEKINTNTPREIIGFFLFLVSAMLKIFAITQFIVSGKGSIPLVLILTLFYLVVVYIHTSHTAYWLAEIKRRRLTSNDYKMWVNDLQNNIPSEHSVISPSVIQFNSLAPMGKEQFQNGRQSVMFINKVQKEDESVEFNYELKSTGVLTDDDIVILTAFFKSEFKRPLINACIEMQLNQIGQVID